MAEGSSGGGLIIAGGGTGGHVLPGIAVADAWKAALNGSGSVTFVGAKGRIEESLVPRAGYPLILLRLGSLNRVSFTQKIKTAFLLPMSFLRSLAVLLSHRPQVVLGVGGFASGPLVLMAALLKRARLLSCKTAILQQDAIPGYTNRKLGNWVDYVFCTLPGTEKYFPKARVLVTGNPVRSSMKRLPPAPRDPFTVFIFGGSQGAMGINTLVLQALPHLRDLQGRLKIIHQTGELDYQRVVEGYRRAEMSARVEKFIHDMPAAYGEASLLICRSGASTMAEIAAVGRAAILIPLPTAADNHQEINARTFESAGAAQVLVQSKSKGEDLARLIREAISDPRGIEAMENAVTRFFRPDATQAIVRSLLNS